MTKITKEVLFTELSIKLAIMDAKLDKLIELAMKPEITIKPLKDSVDALFKDIESTTHYDLINLSRLTHETIK